MWCSCSSNSQSHSIEHFCINKIVNSYQLPDKMRFGWNNTISALLLNDFGCSHAIAYISLHKQDHPTNRQWTNIDIKSSLHSHFLLVSFWNACWFGQRFGCAVIEQSGCILERTKFKTKLSINANLNMDLQVNLVSVLIGNCSKWSKSL